MKILACLLCCALFACSSAQERADALAQKEISICMQRGLEPESPQFEECRLDVKASEDQKKADRVNGFDALQQIQSNHPGHSNPF